MKLKFHLRTKKGRAILPTKFKRTIKHAYNRIVVRRTNEIKSFHYAKLFLCQGLYYANKESRFVRIDSNYFRLKNLLHIYVNTSKNLENKHVNQWVDFSIGCGKVVILNQKEAYGFFFTQNGYDNAYRRFEYYYSKFNYPCVRILSFDESRRCIVMERLYGNQFYDTDHDRIIVTDLLQFSCNASIQNDKDGQVIFLQHGDVNRKNIIWVGEKYFYIDFDNIGYYPPLLDVLHYLCMADYDLDEIVTVLDENKVLLREICSRANIKSANLLDEIFCLYVKHYIKMNACFEDICFLTTKNTVNYPKTHDLLYSRFGDGDVNEYYYKRRRFRIE